MKIEVSTGEIFDKLSILEIKKRKIKDLDKLKNIQIEYDLLKLASLTFIQLYGSGLSFLYIGLQKVNFKLWEIEDSLRDLERENKYYSREFSELARSVYYYNDKRSEIKNEINILTNSKIVEEKSYKKY
ncbi:MAG: DUF6165 family protein [Candidatus Pelagibacter bacterium]|nr:DUF6165 family protein [Candidatus Pelagibacter bacterium]